MKITVREFKAKLKYYLTLISTGQSVEVNGVLLTLGGGKETVATQNEQCGHAQGPIKPTAKDLQALVAHIEAKEAVATPVYTEPLESCAKCGMPTAQLTTHFEDGEEWRVCPACKRKASGRR